MYKNLNWRLPPVYFLKTNNNMEINFDEYDCFIAECYEAEDEFWKGIYEDIEADYWINEDKNNF